MKACAATRAPGAAARFLDPPLFFRDRIGATPPFLYFADVNQELGEPMHRGRFTFLKQFPGVAAVALRPSPLA